MIGTLKINDPAAYLRDYGIVENDAVLLASPLESDSNIVYRIRGQKNSWVMKIADNDNRTNLYPFKVAPDVVVNSYRLAQEWGLSPCLIQADLDQRLIVMEDGGQSCNKLSVYYWSQLVQALNHLHRQKPFSLEHGKDAALNLAESVLSHMEECETAENIAKLIELYRQRGYQESQLVPGHGDLNFGNVIFNANNKIRLIDWDYAGNMPHYWDLAAILINHAIPVEHYRDALKDYDARRIDWEDLSFFCAFYSLVAGSWYSTTLLKKQFQTRARQLFSYHQQFADIIVSNA